VAQTVAGIAATANHDARMTGKRLALARRFSLGSRVKQLTNGMLPPLSLCLDGALAERSHH
jgi:hypothetical protein